MIQIRHLFAFVFATSTTLGACAYDLPEIEGRSLQCGKSQCNIDQDCCISMSGPASHCITRGAGCNGLAAGCNGSEDCDVGAVCCGTFDINLNHYTSIRCESSCGAGQRLMCDNAEGATVCPISQQCLPDMDVGIPGFGVCSP